MAYKLSIQHKGEYLHVKISGATNVQNVLAVWKKVAQVSRRLCVRKVLCEGGLEIPGYEIDLYDYGSRISGTDIPKGTKIALICRQGTYDKLSREGFVLTTRFSVFPQVFADRDKGIDWLTK